MRFAIIRDTLDYRWWALTRENMISLYKTFFFVLWVSIQAFTVCIGFPFSVLIWADFRWYILFEIDSCI